MLKNISKQQKSALSNKERHQLISFLESSNPIPTVLLHSSQNPLSSISVSNNQTTNVQSINNNNKNNSISNVNHTNSNDSKNKCNSQNTNDSNEEQLLMISNDTNQNTINPNLFSKIQSESQSNNNQSESEFIIIIAKHPKWFCDICLIKFDSESLLDSHFLLKSHITKHIIAADTIASMEWKSDIGQRTCDICAVQMRYKHALKTHKYIHNCNWPFICDFKGCYKGFAFMKQLMTHKRVHTTEKPFQCNKCGIKYKFKQNLKRHKQSISSCNDGMQKKCFVCPFKTCDQTFSRNDQLMDHYRIHTGELPYPCLYCNNKYRTATQRSNHHKYMHSIQITKNIVN